MLDKCLIAQCAPTLAGIKTANLFSYPFADRIELAKEMEELNLALKQKGVEIRVLRESGKSALIYVFRPERLSAELHSGDVSDLLHGCGYASSDMDSALETLKQRLNSGAGFPHEIGVFLGYPTKDVYGFIRNGGQNCKYCGYWKVYCDEEEALRTFERYSECRKNYEELCRQGMSIHQLTVAT